MSKEDGGGGIVPHLSESPPIPQSPKMRAGLIDKTALVSMFGSTITKAPQDPPEWQDDDELSSMPSKAVARFTNMNSSPYSSPKRKSKSVFSPRTPTDVLVISPPREPLSPSWRKVTRSPQLECLSYRSIDDLMIHRPLNGGSCFKKPSK